MMKRDVQRVTSETYDLIIIGAGIYGATLLWEATLRGLSAVLLEKDDFGSATSANSLKTIHGGVRYLQHADIQRMRESMRERRNLMRTTPHLVHPLPVLIPTYGHGMKGREIMGAAMIVNDILSMDRNVLKDSQKRIPNGTTISKAKTLEIAPGIREEGLTGGAILYDAQVYNSERHILAFIRSAVERGADAVNYAPVVGFLREGDTVTGVQVEDKIAGERVEVSGKYVINTAGPWISHVLDSAEGPRTPDKLKLAMAMNVVVPQLFDTFAVGISSTRVYRDTDALLNRGSRLLFFSPWRGKTMVGTEYEAYDGHPDDFAITEQQIVDFVEEINHAYPAANITRQDVNFVHAGLLPMDGLDPKTGDVRLSKHYEIRDHREQGVRGVASVVGVKYTTARDVAERTMNWLFDRVWQKSGPRSTSAMTPLWGGQIADFERFLSDAIREQPCGLGAASIRNLVYNYGAAYQTVLTYMEGSADGDSRNEAHLLAAAETRHAVHEEMSQTLADVVFRRTELGSAGHPGDDLLTVCADVMAHELGWDETRKQREVEAVNARFH